MRKRDNDYQATFSPTSSHGLGDMLCISRVCHIIGTFSNRSVQVLSHEIETQLDALLRGRPD